MRFFELFTLRCHKCFCYFFPPHAIPVEYSQGVFCIEFEFTKYDLVLLQLRQEVCKRKDNA